MRWTREQKEVIAERIINNTHSWWSVGFWRKEVKESLTKGDLCEYIRPMKKEARISNFINNYFDLRKLGHIEPAIIDCYVSGEYPSIHKNNLLLVLRGCDRKKLRAANPLPDPKIKNLTLYRGVTSIDPRLKNGLSWTSDKNKAIWFANRYPDNDSIPVVYQVNVNVDRVFFYTNKREEQEYVIDPRYLRWYD